MKTVGDKFSEKEEISTKAQWLVYFILLALLVITVGVAYIPLGQFNLIFAITVALIKAALVVWYFMHLRETQRLIGIFFGSSVFMLAVAALLTFTDYFTRS